MSHIRVLICRVDDPTIDQMTELATFDLPGADVAALQPVTTLDDLETTTLIRACHRFAGRSVPGSGG